nr:carcinoembryonic antigen-related cell adhesion molecule 5-like isoform X3 [Pseudochaenichthys georgianus]
MDIFALLWIVSLAFTGVTDGAGVLPDRLNAAVGGKVMFNTTLTPGTTFQSVNWKFGNEDIFTWNVNNFPAPEYEDRITFIMSTGSLELRNLALTDSGDYTVTILLPGEPPQSGSTRLEVYAPVSNVKVTSSSTEQVEFSSVSLSCSSSGSPLSFLWLNSSSEVTGSDRVQITDGNSTLTVTNVTRYDQGPFRCRVSNPVSEGTSDPVTLTIYSPVSKVTVTSSSTELVEFNSSVSLSCSSSGSSLSFLWLNSSSEVTGSDRVQITDGGSTLTITNVTRYDQGPFSCHVSNPVSNGTSKAVTLIIYHGPENINLKISPPHKPYLEGSNISLSCSAVSNPSAHYTWFLNGGLLSKGSQFNLINSQKNQSGSYSCQAFNDKTLRYEISHPASISVLAPVSNVTITSSSTELVEFSSVSLSCSSSGSPLSVLWLNSSSEVTGSDRVQITDGNSTLTIVNVTRYDKGPFRCQVFNPVSEGTSAPLNLTIYWSNISLMCSADSRPSAVFKWFLNGSQLSDTGSELSLMNVQISQSGNYSCQAFNNKTLRYETSQASVVSVLVQSGCSGGCIAGIVIGVLVVLGVVAAIVWYFLWYKKKQKKERSAGNTNTRTGVEGQDNGAYTRSQEMHYADVRFTKKNNGETVQMGDQNKPSDYAEVRVNNNPRAAASSLPTYDAHLQRNKRPAPQPEITEIYAQVRKN